MESKTAFVRKLASKAEFANEFQNMLREQFVKAGRFDEPNRFLYVQAKMGCEQKASKLVGLKNILLNPHNKACPICLCCIKVSRELKSFSFSTAFNHSSGAESCKFQKVGNSTCPFRLMLQSF